MTSKRDRSEREEEELKPDLVSAFTTKAPKLSYGLVSEAAVGCLLLLLFFSRRRLFGTSTPPLSLSLFPSPHFLQKIVRRQREHGRYIGYKKIVMEAS